ncbi:DUF4244 domain-containing protein [Citricoccus nitrophenolicus]|uniref:DUF4244 domain-containing protein n=1 Tax=Citricoccus nitrophenolicus TaxID=863575 RepID=A0ABV0IKI5_9MICC
MTATVHPEVRDQDQYPTPEPPSSPALSRAQDRVLHRSLSQGPDWHDETGAQTAEYGIVTLAAVGFAGVLAVILAGADVQGLLLGIVQDALSFG